MSAVVNNFGDDQLPKKITNKAQFRGHPLKEDNATAQSNNWVENQYDPHTHVKRFPDGTQIIICYGKNPRMQIHHSSGTSLQIFADGSLSQLVAGNKFEMNKAGETRTVEGHYDAKFGGHVRENIHGGHYKDVAGDHAVNVSGNAITHTAGNRTDLVQGNHTIRGNKQLVLGTQDDSGSLMISINMHNGIMEITSKGDIEIGSTTGAVKLKGKSVSIHADDTLALDAGNRISHSSDLISTSSNTVNMYAKISIASKPLPAGWGTADDLGDKGIHDGIASSQQSYQASNTINTA